MGWTLNFLWHDLDEVGLYHVDMTKLIGFNYSIMRNLYRMITSSLNVRKSTKQVCIYARYDFIENYQGWKANGFNEMVDL